MLLLKTACFSLWFTMMLFLALATKTGTGETKPCFDPISLHLDDVRNAELQIYNTLRNLLPGQRLNLEIAEQNPSSPELYYIASHINKKYPAIIIRLVSPTSNKSI